MPGRTILQNSLSQHLSGIAAARRRTRENENPEGLHDLRVAIRALRAILPLLGKRKPVKALRDQWKSIAHATSPVRDLEVLIELLDHIPAETGNVRIRLAAEEVIARRELFRMLASAEFPLLLQASRKLVVTPKNIPETPTLRKRAQKRADNLLDSIREQIAVLGPETHARDWHALRLTIKHLRYLIEHGGEWLPRTWGKLHPPLKQCQAALGELHDLDMLYERTPLRAPALYAARQATARNAVVDLERLISHARA
ncbi:CHAD domain-containing protein [Formivibrio citricus]|uniref:CHAD domain-containing protein n=1 Tax=Formivibrio citricus TaxID=83765 RepID=A0A1I5B7F7_9NEIS|nr:CHAD domain-containing protein [Formivibrio citricus]SFN70645.1 CHAD domain-containing protein [Formivibrio citricus]